jgi:DNA-binding NarL/FixJ family response regulator
MITFKNNNIQKLTMDKKVYKIILADDHTLFRDGLKLLIEKEEIGIVIGEAENGLQVLNLIENEKPDLVVMDIDMPVISGLEATEKAVAKFPDLNILILSMHGEQHYYNELINVGAKGFVHKTAGKQELQTAICNVAEGGNHFSNELLRKIIMDINKPQINVHSESSHIELTDRELEILRLFCSGFTASEIASTIFLSVKTVEAHRSKLLHKTETKNTIALVLYAIKNKIVSI